MTPELKRRLNRLSASLKSEKGKWFLKAGKILLQSAIIMVLLYQIISIGWRNILEDLPAHPLFYVIFLLLYFALPITEYFTYSQSWRIPFWKSQGIFLTKRVYNKTVLGYSGEVQLFFWLQNQEGVNSKSAYEVIRDNNILSTLASTFIALTILSFFLVSGRLSLFEWVDHDLLLFFPFLILIVIISIFLIRRYQTFIFTMEKNKAILIFFMHTGRMLALMILQVLQWHVVLPEVSMDIWFTLIALQLVLSRIPFLPNKDLLFIGGSLELGRHVEIASASLAGLLLVNYILDKLMNLVVMLSIPVKNHKSNHSKEIEPDDCP